MKKIKKYFKLPGPKALGWSNSDALGMRELTPFQEGKTWEDWHEYVQEHYPVRYFLIHTMPKFFRPIKWKIENIWYKIKLINPKNRHYMLDLRNIDPLNDHYDGRYRYDPCTIMYLSAWGSLRKYVEKEGGLEKHNYSIEEIKKCPGLDEQKHFKYDEPAFLYNYWMVERAKEEKEDERLYKIQKDHAINRDREAYEQASKIWLDHHINVKNRDNEMFMRLCSIREHLWT